MSKEILTELLDFYIEDFQELTEEVQIPDNVTYEKLSSMLEAAYKAVALSKRLKNPAEREKYLTIATQGVEKIILALQKKMKSQRGNQA